MPPFSPVALFEQARQETTANQAIYYERFRELLKMGTAIVIGEGKEEKWFVLAPSSRLETRVFFAQDLAVDGEAGLHRIEFEELDYSYEGNRTWGWFDVGGWPVASFRPIAWCDTPEWVTLWNTRSGCAPVKLVT